MKHEATAKDRPLMPVELICKLDGLPMPEPEYRFDEERRWRFDWAWRVVVEGCCDYQTVCVALEIEGGAFTRGRHTRGTGFLRDMEKYNRATALGWKVFRCTPTTIHLGMQLVKTALGGGWRDAGIGRGHDD